MYLVSAIVPGSMYRNNKNRLRKGTVRGALQAAGLKIAVGIFQTHACSRLNGDRFAWVSARLLENTGLLRIRQAKRLTHALNMER